MNKSQITTYWNQISTDDKQYYYFFWNSNYNPFDTTIPPQWTPYDITDNFKLVDAYENYIKVHLLNMIVEIGD